jgi:hypothetical protein
VLEASSFQFLFADLQPPIVARSKTNPPDALAASAGVLLQAARLLRLPVHFSVVPEGGKAPVLIDALDRLRADTPLLPRMSADPCLDPASKAAFAASGKPNIMIAGFATEVVVVHAALSALNAGYNVYVPVDSCGGMSSRSEDAAFRQIESAGGITTSTVWLLTALTPDFSNDPGAQIFQLLQSLRLA